MRNSFGVEIPERKMILESEACSNYVEIVLENYLGILGVKEYAIPDMIKQIFNLGKLNTDDYTYEESVHNILIEHISQNALDKALEERAERIFEQIKPHLIKGSTLDYGSGDGRVGMFVNDLQGYVTLADIYKNPNNEKVGLPFIPLGTKREESNISTDSFDNILLITVYHHCDFSMDTISDSIRVAKSGGRLIIIESVCEIQPNLQGIINNNSLTQSFMKLSLEDQLAVNVFFDHFYNRCIHYFPDPKMKVNVPYNYLTHDGWKAKLIEASLNVIKIIPLGIDQPLAPLFHTLYVAEK